MDQVIRWNRTLLQIIRTPGAQPATVHPARNLAIMTSVIEDLHWAHRSTLDLLTFLVRNLRAALLLVLTYRTDELHRRHPLRPFLAELERSEQVERLDVDRFDRVELAACSGDLDRAGEALFDRWAYGVPRGATPVAEMIEAVSAERPMGIAVTPTSCLTTGTPQDTTCSPAASTAAWPMLERPRDRLPDWTRGAAVVRPSVVLSTRLFLQPAGEEGVKICPPAVKKPLRQASSASRADLITPVSILCCP